MVCTLRKEVFVVVVLFSRDLLTKQLEQRYILLLRILVIPKHLPLTINKYNNTAVSAASKAQINITKSKILLSK